MRSNERGMVSIMTTMVLMIVITLIVLGFAQISRRDQREAIDNQLSTQAFYAAETGVNDARNLIESAVKSGTALVDKTGCTSAGPGGFYASLNPVIDAAQNVKYSCLLVDTAPSTLHYTDVAANPSLIIPATTASGAPVSSVKLDWQSKVAGTPISGCPTSLPAATGNGIFVPGSSWSCGYGVLRVDLVPTSGALTTDGLRNATMTTFAVPFRVGGTSLIPYAASTANSNNAVGVACTNSGCSLTVNGLSQNSYYLRISSMYRDVALQVCLQDSTGTCMPTQGAQVVIDSTGKAQDVLRRIQVSVPVLGASTNQLSDFAIQSTDSICKRFAVLNGYFSSSVSSAIPGGLSSSNPLCQ